MSDNDKMLTAAELDRLRALYNDATPDEWQHSRYNVSSDGVPICMTTSHPDSAFITGAHNAFDKLLHTARRALLLETVYASAVDLLQLKNPSPEFEPQDFAALQAYVKQVINTPEFMARLGAVVKAVKAGEPAGE